MVEARDIIANAIRRRSDGRWSGPPPETVARCLIEDLTAAGWTLAPPGSRVVPEGGVDAPTVERCANHLDVLAEANHDRAAYRTEGGEYHTLFTERGKGLSEGADALRAFAEAKP